MKAKSTSIYDILGISSASLCLIHCIIFPILAILPLGFTHNKIIDILFASVGIVIALKIIISSNNNIVKIIFVSGITIFVLNLIISIIFEIENELVILGGIIMIVGHLYNFRNLKH